MCSFGKTVALLAVTAMLMCASAAPTGPAFSDTSASSFASTGGSDRTRAQPRARPPAPGLPPLPPTSGPGHGTVYRPLSHVAPAHFGVQPFDSAPHYASYLAPTPLASQPSEFYPPMIGTSASAQANVPPSRFVPLPPLLSSPATNPAPAQAPALTPFGQYKTYYRQVERRLGLDRPVSGYTLSVFEAQVNSALLDSAIANINVALRSEIPKGGPQALWAVRADDFDLVRDTLKTLIPMLLHPRVIHYQHMDALQARASPLIRLYQNWDSNYWAMYHIGKYARHNAVVSSLDSAYTYLHFFKQLFDQAIHFVRAEGP
ncbi:hypothetical protein BCV70DRAFT_231816 [Testicularia cyperi]|uniref:Uncharacterized protein n=1 Tax=Testicularia cyperi TaxID=1882483 RepID=A0A317XPH0_9BASI|nr:hypothetical protein BCV70DRAFT_231816 [Testicularia cyperi]